jgi:hypothetical protein
MLDRLDKDTVLGKLEIAHFLALIQSPITATMYVSLGVTGMKPGALFRRISTGAWPTRCML